MAIDIGRIDEALRAVGIPIIGVQNARGVITVDYAPEATAAQRAQGDALVAGWDESAEAAKERRKNGRKALVSHDPVAMAARNSLRVIYASLTELRQAYNALRAYVRDPAYNPVPPPLVIRSWSQALTAVRQQIDAETDPES